MEKSVDILVATYNGEKYIKEQLDSLINQTYNNINIIICDDMSTDGTVKILEDYSKQYNNIKYYINEKNLGYIKNFEKLLTKVESEYFMLCDQDDVWLPNKVENTLNKLISEDANLVFTDLEIVDKDLNMLHPSMIDFIKIRYYVNKYNDYKMEYLINCVTGCTLLSKKELISKIIPIPDNKPMVHDWWIGLIAGQTGKIAFLNETTVKYRQHGENQIGAYSGRDVKKTFKEYRKEYIELRISQFKICIENENKFMDNLKDLNKQALKYYEHIDKVKYINFRYYRTFLKIYKWEKSTVKIKRFLLLNMPLILKPLNLMKR